MPADVNEHFMLRALELAEKGRGHVSPNPMVGCVIEHEGKIIGEGWHQEYGGAHAEVNAIESVKNQDILTESTCYVTLEPCAHFGRTPPCADLLVSHQIKRVVIGCLDINPLVQGSGVSKLEKAGIKVQVGVLEEECKKINVRFFKSFEKQKPYVILKWAQTGDGFIARENFDSKWISNEQSRILVHQWRADEDAILVGSRTAEHDDPMLNVRQWEGKNPLRLVIDRALKLDHSLKLFDGSIPTIVYNTEHDDLEANPQYVKLDQNGFLDALLSDLHQRKIQSLFVEGGTELHNLFLNQGSWDEARVFTSNTEFGSGVAAPNMELSPNETMDITGDTLNIFYNEQSKSL